MPRTRKTLQHHPLTALDAAWEHYRVSHMFPELAATSKKELLAQMRLALHALVARCADYERRLSAIETRRARRPRKGTPR